MKRIVSLKICCLLKKKKLINAVILLVTILCVASSVWAYNVYGHILIGGVGKQGKFTRGYWKDSTVSAYNTLITDAMYNWCNTENRHPYVRTSIWFVPSAKSSSVMDIYAQQTPPASNVIAETQFYRYAYNETRANPYNEDWVWCKIIIYKSTFDNLPSDELGTRIFKQEGTISHEMGHVFGLDHTSTTTSVMCQLGSGRTVKRPSADDCYGINYLYPLSSN